MFGYEIVDLLLFDAETFLSLLVEYSQSIEIYLYTCLILSFLFSFFLRIPMVHRLAAIYLATGWICSGFFFYLNLFEPIYWVAKYLAYFFFVMAFLIVLSQLPLLKGGYPITRLKQYAFFILSICLPLTVYLLNPQILISAGTHASLAGLLTVTLFFRSKNPFAIAAFILSLIWSVLFIIAALAIE